MKHLECLMMYAWMALIASLRCRSSILISEIQTKRAVIERLLRNEMKRLALWPYLCHSLIITGRRPQ